MTRREAREKTLELLYEMAARPEEPAEEVFEASVQLREIEANDYIKDVYFGVFGHSEELDEKIKSVSLDWSTERMSRVTLSILRLAAYELYYIRNIPVSVSINEAVELAKKYDIDSAPAFINGILSKLGKDPTVEKDPYPQKKRK